MRKVLILGATGSIGTTALNAVRDGKLDVKITGLAARHNEDRLKALAEEFDCPYIINDDSNKLDAFIASSDSDIALNGIAGSPGLEASLMCIKHSVDLALANKESVVMGGSFLFESAQKNGAKIIPVDSEHSAIYNLLRGHEDEVSKLVITASGGPFLNRRDLENVTVEEACSHPTWKMGRKISIDSSTLANKGLEVIEAGFLFNMPAEKIEVTIHRQSIVHSMIRLENGAVYAQLSPPDMTLPIISALNDGHQDLHNVVNPLSFEDLTLTFHPGTGISFLCSLWHTMFFQAKQPTPLLSMQQMRWQCLRLSKAGSDTHRLQRLWKECLIMTGVKMHIHLRK